jgi:hypothetical protein
MDPRTPNGIWILERPDTDEGKKGSGTAVMAPDRDVAFGTASDLLAAAGLRGGVDYFGVGGEARDVDGLDYGIEGEGRAGFSLAPLGG